MAAWFEFALYALNQIVSTVFNLDLGIGFSLGDFEVACLVIGIIAVALIVKTGSFARVSHEYSNSFGSSSLANNRDSNKITF